MGGLGALAACGQAGGAPGGQSSAGTASGKVTYMSQGTDPSDELRYKPLVDEYNAKKGPVTIELIQGDPGGSAATAQGKLIAMVASGTAPDVFWNHAYIAPTLIKLNMLADLQPFFKKDTTMKLSNYFEAPTKDYEFEGKQYGIPREATTTLLVYNKELFGKNGVSLPTDNWTWDDFLKAATQLTKGEGAQKTWGVAGIVGTGGAVYYSYPKVWEEGGDVVDKGHSKMTLHQSPAVDQMQYIVDLINKQKVHPWGADQFPGQNMQEGWATGRIGMAISISVYTNFNKAQFEWDVTHLPKGSKGNRVTRTASAGHSMTAASKNKDAAWEILKLLGAKSSYEHWAKNGLTIPTYKEVANGPIVLNPNQPPKSAKVALDAFSYARPEPISGDWGTVGTTISTAMNDAYGGKTDAKGALTAIVPVVESLLAKTPAVTAATPAK